MIIDAHVHLDDRVVGGLAGAVEELVRQMQESKIQSVVALHLETQPWTGEEFARAVAPHAGIRPFVNVHPERASAKDELTDAIQRLQFTGLKLHPRLQEFVVDSPNTVALVRHAGELRVPVLIDAFPDGTHLQQGFDPLRYANLARQCPDTRIIVAHMGGHRVLDFLMLMKRLPNMFMDTSYSLLYYRGSSVPGDMIYAMRSLRFQRVFYGSDYPDRPLAESANESLALLRSHGVDDGGIAQLMHRNFTSFVSGGA
jgi:predicted TIM-barrel fold metal-dependent hydrolase